jgi:hypothetical protein
MTWLNIYNCFLLSLVTSMAMRVVVELIVTSKGLSCLHNRSFAYAHEPLKALSFEGKKNEIEIEHAWFPNRHKSFYCGRKVVLTLVTALYVRR